MVDALGVVGSPATRTLQAGDGRVSGSNLSSGHKRSFSAIDISHLAL